MKVLHLNQYLTRKGGVETYLLALLPMLQARGLEQQVLFDADAEGTPEFDASIAVPGLGRNRFGGHEEVRRRVAEVLRSERPDVVHVHNIQSVGALQACFAYGPTLLTTHDYRFVCPASSFFYRRTREVCTRRCGPGCFTTTLRHHCLTPRPAYAGYFYHRTQWVIRNAARFAHVIAPSGGAQARLVQAGFDPARMTVLPYFCPLHPAPAPRPVPEETTLTYIGRIAPNKGHEYFVQALGLLPADVKGVMVGNFSEDAEREVTQLAVQSGCADRLVLRKWATREEVLQLLDRTTVFVFPSLWPETLGIVGLEALSRGVPVVASDLGGVREWLQDGENGVLVQPKAAGQIADAVRFLTASRERLTAYGARGLQTIHDRFLPVHHTDRLVRLYEQVCLRAEEAGEIHA